jgi:hypothetical protein
MLGPFNFNQPGAIEATGGLFIAFGFFLFAVYEWYAILTRKVRPITYQMREQIGERAHFYVCLIGTVLFFGGAVFAHFYWR